MNLQIYKKHCYTFNGVQLYSDTIVCLMWFYQVHCYAGGAACVRMDSISMSAGSAAFLPNGVKMVASRECGRLVAGAAASAPASVVGIVGSGDFAKSLTLRLLRSGFSVVVGSRHPKRAAEAFPHVVDVTHHEDAVEKAAIIFLAIRREHYASLWGLKHLLVGKVLVDVSNNRRMDQYPESNAEYLASLFPESFVVKGFNVISAWAMQSSPKDTCSQVGLMFYQRALNTHNFYPLWV